MQGINWLHLMKTILILLSIALVVIVMYIWWGYQLTKTVQNGGPQAITEILHIEYRIVCCIATYLIHKINFVI